MRVAVAGATGLVGRNVVASLTRQGHDPVALSRSRGVDLVAGTGLGTALAGVDAVIDVVNTDAFDAEAAVRFFAAATGNLLAAAEAAGVGHAVVLSIVNVDLVEDNGHYAGKRRQEQVLRDGDVPWSIVRATQFFDFAEQVVGWTTTDGVAAVPPLLMQPVAVPDVAEALVDTACGPATGGISEVAGPDPHDLVDMARRVLAVRGDGPRLRPSWRGGVFGTEMAGEVLLPGPSARLAPTTFDEWLAAGARTP